MQSLDKMLLAKQKIAKSTSIYARCLKYFIIKNSTELLKKGTMKIGDEEP
jgi:hypothetical protein